MSQSGSNAPEARLTTLGIRGKALGLAGLGLCALPCVLLVLIWRDTVLIAGVAPIFALCSATIAAIATLIGLDVILRPVSLTGKALDRLLGGAVPSDLPQRQIGPEGRLMTDAQRVIDELIALRAELPDDTRPIQIPGRAEMEVALTNNAESVQAVIVMRLANPDMLPLGPKGEELTAMILAEMTQRLRCHYGAKLNIGSIGRYDLAFAMPLLHPDIVATTDFQQALDAVIVDLTQQIRSDEFSFFPKVLTGIAIQEKTDLSDETISRALDAVETAACMSPMVIYTEDLPRRARDRAAMSLELRQAIRNEEFELYYQPVMDTSHNRPIGAEALIRWHSPARGFVPPDAFIPLAEANGLIDPIGQWVLRQACKQASKWDPALRVSINLGARQFLDEDLTWHISEAIAAAGIRADQLEIELTEAVAMVDQGRTKTAVTALRDIGVGIAIEDFGKGQANLGMIRKTPFTTLKIDREFVTDVHQNQGSQAICDALISLGVGLGFAVVAEGTEQAEEVKHLSALGCSLFQGYYFARPVSAHVIGATFNNLRLNDGALLHAG